MWNFLANQRDNLFWCVPFIMAMGAALYFGITTEPNIPHFNIVAIIVTVLSAVGMVFLRRPILLRAIFIFIFGFSYAATFTYMVATPQISHPMRNTQITGIVTDIDYTPDKTRIFIHINNNDNLDNVIVRVSIDASILPPQVGDKIRATVSLFPPNGAYAPETFDMARWAYFNGITATGFISEFSVIENTGQYTINSIRDYLHNTSKSFLSDGLILGYKNSIPVADKQIWTTTGIGHVWSISGFHFALMSGWLFAIFYFIFRMIPPITNRVPARISAMCAVWIMLLMYMTISGCAVATIRSFLMISLVIAAMILGRGAISLRNVCLVFCILLLINPHYVMQAGFQLSFSAVFGLVWFWNNVSPRMPNNKILKVLYIAVLTSIVATIFTAPFVIAHFGSLPLYGLIGNLILLPIFSLVIMPCATIGTITGIFGITTPLDLAHMIYNKTLGIAELIANIPYANVSMPHIPNVAICLIVAGFTALLFIRSNKFKLNYIIAGAFITIATAVTFMTPRAIFFATPDHELVAFEYDGHLEFNKSRASNNFFAFDTFRQLRGDTLGDTNIRHKSDDGVWIYETAKFKLAYMQKFVPLQKNIVRLCRDDNIDYIVSYFGINAKNCNWKILRGGFIIYPSGRVRHTPHNRPWHNPRG